MFFRILAPLILQSNEWIKQEWEKLSHLKYLKFSDASEKQWLTDLAVKYKVIKTLETEVSEKHIQELLLKVDVLPPSLVMAQAAEESGWGTSRFAGLGNALFG